MAKSGADGTLPTLLDRCTQSARSPGLMEETGATTSCSTTVGAWWSHQALFVQAVMRHLGPVAEYHRDGNLYLSDFTMSDFVRQGQDSYATGNRNLAVKDL